MRETRSAEGTSFLVDQRLSEGKKGAVSAGSERASNDRTYPQTA